MADNTFGRDMKRWNQLREDLAEANAAKAHAEVVRICDEIASFAAATPAIRVLEFMFDKRAAKALAALGRFSEAIVRVERAIAECKRYRATATLGQPDDFLREIVGLERLRDRWRKNRAQ